MKELGNFEQNASCINLFCYSQREKSKFVSIEAALRLFTHQEQDVARVSSNSGFSALESSQLSLDKKTIPRRLSSHFREANYRMAGGLHSGKGHN